MTDKPKKLNERILENNYPVHAGYAYVLDGVPKTIWISGTVFDLKRSTGADEIRNCDLSGRNLL